MIEISISDSCDKESNLLYVQTALRELLSGAGSKVKEYADGYRAYLEIGLTDGYGDIIITEVADVLAEVIAINYKYEYFNGRIKVAGLKSDEREIMLASLISADLTEDKKYVFDKIIKGMEKNKDRFEVSIDGIYNFMLKPLKKKWEDVVSFIPEVFLGSQLKDFIGYLLESKKKRVYIDSGNVYDNHYRKLMRCDLMRVDKVRVIREVLMSGAREVEITGAIPKEDEYYLKEFFGDKIIFSQGTVKNR